MSDFKPNKATKNSISAGAAPQTPVGEITALTQTPADPIPALGSPVLETTCLPKYVSLNPPIIEKRQPASQLLIRPSQATWAVNTDLYIYILDTVPLIYVA